MLKLFHFFFFLIVKTIYDLKEKQNFFSNQYFLKHWKTNQLQNFIPFCLSQNYIRNQIVVKSGEKLNAMFFIMKGEFEVK